MMAMVAASAVLVASLGAIGHVLPLLLVLTLFGYAGSIAGLLQFTLVQGHTPDAMLGRVGSLWSAQDVVGDAGGALGLGALGRLFGPLPGLVAFGLAGLAGTALMAVGFGRLRGLRADQPPVSAGA